MPGSQADGARGQAGPDRARTDRAAPWAGSFEHAWAVAAHVPGWLTEPQAHRLWDETVRLSAGAHVVEIGSHQGRSTVVLARALMAATQDGRLTAIDPFVTGPRYGGAATRTALEGNLDAAGVSGIVTIIEARSRDVRHTWGRPIDLLWVDGKHDYWTCSDDLKWSGHLPVGGRVLVHDAFSSLGVTAALLVHVLPTGRLRLVDRVGSLAILEVGRPSGVDRLRFLGHLPWWGRNLVVKVLLRLRMRGLVRLLGHHDSADPY